MELTIVLKVKRVYDTVPDNDGFRILVDRIWPRGMSQAEAELDLWLKDVAPSDGLRKWFGHEEERWGKFKDRYHKELGDKEDLVSQITDKMLSGNVTLLFGARDREFNNAVALKEYIEKRQKRL